MDALKKALFRSPWYYVAALVLSAVIGVARYFALGEGVYIGFALYDCISVAGGVTFLVGGLFAVAHFGAFDMFSYVFSPDRLAGKQKYKSFAHYSQAMEEKRGRQGYTFLPFFVVGIVVFLISLLFA